MEKKPVDYPIDVAAGLLAGVGVTRSWRYSEIASVFHIAEGESDRFVYSTSMANADSGRDELVFGLTRISAGAIDGEFHMTRGHDHEERAGETYTFFAGSGGVLCRKHDAVAWVEVTAPSVTYIPPDWAHRTINTGDEDLVFLSAVSATAGHDYRAIEREGMGARVFRRSGVVELVLDAGCRLATF